MSSPPYNASNTVLGKNTPTVLYITSAPPLESFPFSSNHLLSPKGDNSTMEIEQISSSHYPPGFRFHPSDEELIVHYLLKKLGSRPLPAGVVTEIELYNYNPWELPNKSLFGEDEWYFFTPRDRKYPNGERPNRTAASGYWKATGTDKPILSASGSRSIGVKKALVFYKGRPPKGEKTGWIMTEYRLPDTMTRSARSKRSMRLDDWVLCRIHQKGNMSKNNWAANESPSRSVNFSPKIEELPSAYTKTNTEIMSKNNWAGDESPSRSVNFLPKIEELPSAYIKTNTEITTDYLLKDCHVLASMLACQDLPPIENISNATFPRRNYSTNSGSSFYDHTLGKGNYFTTSSFFESFLNPTKAKLNEGNRFDNFIGSNKMVTEINGNEVLIPGNMMTTTAMNFYNQNQAPGNIFNPSQSDAIMNLILSREEF